MGSEAVDIPAGTRVWYDSTEGCGYIPCTVNMDSHPSDEHIALKERPHAKRRKIMASEPKEEEKAAQFRKKGLPALRPPPGTVDDERERSATEWARLVGQALADLH